MSNSRCFFYDIPDLEVTNMDCMNIVKSEEISEPQDENQKLKEAYLLLKRKISLSHELIKQYNDKIKECQNLNMELEAVRKNSEHIMRKHNSNLTKMTKLKLENAQYQQKFEHSSKYISDQEIKIAADKQHLEQLICKVNDLERNVAEKTKKEYISKDKIQALERQLKAVRKSHETEMKKMEIKLNNISAPKIVNTQIIKKEKKVTHEKYTCTGNELEDDLVKRETMDKCTLTNDFYSIKDDPYPLFCSKCEVKFDTVPLDQILRQMSACPSPISEVSSPKKSEKTSSHENSAAPIEIRISQSEMNENHSNYVNQIIQTEERYSDSTSNSEFQRLEQKLQNLERKFQKKLKTSNECKNLRCTYEHPSSYYLGPHPYHFHSYRPMARPPYNFVDYQTLQRIPISRKRKIKLNVNKSSRSTSILQKKRRIDSGTSPWEVSPIARDLRDPDKASFIENNSELSFESSGSNSPGVQSLDHKINATKHHNDAEPHPLSRREIRDDVISQFSPVTSPTSTPNEYMYTAEKFCSGQYIHTTEVTTVVNKATSNLEISSLVEVPTQNCGKISESSPNLHDKDCTAEKPIKDTTNIRKKSVKCSLMKKIRNLKNSHNIKHLANKTNSLNSSAIKPTRNNVLKTMVSVTEIKSDLSNVQKIQSDTNTNDTSINCPTKKLRIAHNVRKSEEKSLNKVNRNTSESTRPSDLEKIEIQLVPSSDNATIDTYAVPDNKKFNKFLDFMGPTKCDKHPDLSVTKQCKSNSNDDTIDISKLVNDATAKREELVLGRQVVSDEAETKRLNNAVVSEPSNNKNMFQSQSYMISPKMSFEVNSAPDPCDLSKCAESDLSRDAGFETNLNVKVEKHSEGYCFPRVLKTNTELNSPIPKISPSCKMKVPDADNSEGKSLERPAKSVSHVLGMELIRYGGTNPSESFDDDEVMHATEVSNNLAPVKPGISEQANTVILDKNVTSSVIDSQFGGIILSPPNNLHAKTCTNFETNDKVMNETVSNTQQAPEDNDGEYIKASGLRDLIERHFTSSKNKGCHKLNKGCIKLQTRKENLVLKELLQITEDPEWTNSKLAASVERLSKFKTHTIAKCITDFLSTKAKDHEELDHTHTPPAPLLSKTQQRILTTIVVLNRTMPQIMQLVQDGIQYKLFRLNFAPEVEVVEELTRVFTALARIQKDREKVRILCCDAFYCLGLKAFPLTYVALISWPEVFPMAGACSDPLILCLTEIILSVQGDLEFPKFCALKKHITTYYKYKNDGNGSPALIKNFMTTLKEKRQNGLDTAMILFAKKKAPDWTYNNFIQGLMQMIIENTHPCIYDAFCLLGHLMRSFPVEDENGLVQNILEQLCALIESGEGSMELQEGVATALLNFTRHKPKVVTSTLLKWTPKEPMSKTLTHRLTTLIETCPVGWWKKILRSNDMQKY
ncbi:uncharacterized protein LOC105690416 [Athalia rosae]|uniref:uncharacterized protein LOC105690416 n=1 Tax=Athalia rosae TaxID=37344 RepID=UPI00203366F0|nr:uncharacterized protein LOC105690416 [Athalia rosae]